MRIRPDRSMPRSSSPGAGGHSHPQLRTTLVHLAERLGARGALRFMGVDAPLTATDLRRVAMLLPDHAPRAEARLRHRLGVEIPLMDLGLLADDLVGALPAKAPAVGRHLVIPKRTVTAMQRDAYGDDPTADAFEVSEAAPHHPPAVQPPPPSPVALHGGHCRAAPTRAEQRALYRKLLTNWDSNGNGVLDRADLERALRDPRLSMEEGAMVATLLSFAREGHPIAAQSFAPSAPSNKDWRNRFAAFWQSVVTYSIQMPPLFLDGKPDARFTQQGTIGDCWLVATAASLAEDHPAQLMKLFESLPDGKIAVTFPGHAPVVVDPPTPAELALLGSGRDGIWLTTLEQAYGKLRQVSRKVEKSLVPDPLPVDRLDGGRGQAAIEALTGHEAKWHWLAGGDSDCMDDQSPVWTLAEAELRRILTAATQEHRLMTATVTTSQPNLPAPHVYTVLGYDPASDTVLVRNPWGHTEPRSATPHGLPDENKTDDGIFRLSLAAFTERFATVSWETNEPHTGSVE